MAEETLGKRQMVASYDVTITGIDRTKAELAKLDQSIQRLRTTEYSKAVPNVTIASSIGVKDVFQTRMDDLEGRVQKGASDAMASSMALGRRRQTEVLDAAVTPTGAKRFARTGKGSAGRHTGKPNGLISTIGTNVETLKLPNETRIAGWHGWPTTVRSSKLTYQEKGSGRITAANSLGHAILQVREHLKKELGKLKR